MKKTLGGARKFKLLKLWVLHLFFITYFRKPNKQLLLQYPLPRNTRRRRRMIALFVFANRQILMNLSKRYPSWTLVFFCGLVVDLQIMPSMHFLVLLYYLYTIFTTLQKDLSSKAWSWYGSCGCLCFFPFNYFLIMIDLGSLQHLHCEQYKCVHTESPSEFAESAVCLLYGSTKSADVNY